VQDADVVVVGSGVVGAWIALALVRGGRSVIALERASVGHPAGSSHGSSRFRQLAPHPTEAYLDHGRDALSAWLRLERDADVRILHRVGNLSIGEPAQLEALARILAEHQLQVELVDPVAARSRWQGFSPAGPVVFQSDGDAIAADMGWRATVEAARRAGAELREGVEVLGVAEADTEALVRTEAGDLRCRTVVLAAGPWVGPLTVDAGIDLNLSVHRQTVLYVRAGARFPTITDWSGREPYALPDLRGRLKLAEHARGPVADPDTSGEPDPAAVDRLLTWARTVLPGAAVEPVRAETCLYTMTPDEGFAIERSGRVIAVSACSGQGFQYAPVVGAQVAALLDT
jgi:sarcosine oxidase